ncbi:MAG: hypothetical protein AAF715_14860 [Myxococcota bacterium]
MLRTSFVASLVVIGAIGCGSDPQDPPQTPPVASNTAPVPPPPPPPPAPVVDTGPCDATMTAAMQTAIQSRESKELKRGMKAEGAFMCERVAEGQVLKLPITIQPKRCYTVLAGSFPNVTDIDVVLKPNLGDGPANPLLAPIANTVLAQDADIGLNASIGAGENCYRFNLIPGFEIPLAAVVEVTVKAGSGPVSVQAYAGN